MKKHIAFAVTSTVIAALVAGLILTSIIASARDKTSKPVSSDIKQLVEDYSLDRITAKSASITPRQLIVTKDDDTRYIYDLPEDEFFLSIAPYVNQTHPCAMHNLVACRGEMANETFKIYIIDDHGHVIIDDHMVSNPKGFIDLWLPREQNYQVTIKHQDRTAIASLSTFDDDPTCITTIQLK